MKEKINTYLQISLYYNINDWDRLLIKGLKPYFDGLAVKKIISQCLICLSRYRGDNIRLYFILNSKVGKTQFLLDFDDYFKAFFKEHPSLIQLEKGGTVQPLKFFSDFPNDSIQYNVHDFLSCVDAHGVDITSLRASISNFLISKHFVVKKSYDCISHLSIIFHFAMMKSYIQDLNKVYSLLETMLIETDFINTHAEVIVLLDSKFRKEKEIYLSLLSRFWQSNQDFLARSQPDWSEECAKLTKRVCEFREYCFLVSQIIGDHLEFKDWEWYYPLYFTYRTIKELEQG